MKKPIETYYSGDIKVSKSAHHDDMWILSNSNGGWWNLNCSIREMHILHPPNPEEDGNEV